MKCNIAVVAIFSLFALNVLFKPIADAVATAKQQQFVKVELQENESALTMNRNKREHIGKAPSIIDLILSIMNSLPFSKPNLRTKT